MKVGVALLLTAAAACGRSTKEPAVIANLDESGITPIWLAADSGTVYVGFYRGEAETALSTIDEKSGAVHPLARSLPAGAFTRAAGKTYFLEFYGAVGTIDPNSGAYTQIAKLPSAGSVIAVQAGNVLVGKQAGVQVVEASGATRALDGVTIGQFESITTLAATPTAAFATTTTQDKIFRIDGAQVSILAKGQVQPALLAANQTQVAWAVGEGDDALKTLVTAPVAGGEPTELAHIASGRIRCVAATKSGFVFAVSSEKGDEAGVYQVAPGKKPTKLASGEPTQIAAGDGKVYWVEDASKGWVIRSAALR